MGKFEKKLLLGVILTFGLLVLFVIFGLSGYESLSQAFLIVAVILYATVYICLSIGKLSKK